ncbi:MAG: zinc-ribbon domain-containing protein [Clostridia bacterium]|nr:zinc-ribbon domain-containing protein [Clostridia bacterium]
MNCPNCGRPLSETANICPKCKTKIYHNTQGDSNYNEDGTRKTVSLDDRPLKRKGSALKSILLVLLMIIVIIALVMILIPDKVIDFCENISWLEWLADLLKSIVNS